MSKTTHRLLAVMIVAMPWNIACSDDLLVAVASNFHNTFKAIVGQFEETHGHRVTLVPGSTGKHYAQIVNGAPFDIFLAADEKRPRLLEQQNLAVSDTRFTYALGRLVLWSPTPDYVDPTGEVLRGSFDYLAIANPKLAPYGRASKQVLRNLDVWDKHASHLVRGENIAQTFQIIASKNAELGFVAYSQLLTLKPETRGSFWLVPETAYDPIKQQGLLLKESGAGRALIAFIQSSQTRRLILKTGYALPNAF